MTADSLHRAANATMHRVKDAVKTTIHLSGWEHRAAQRTGGAHIVMLHGVGGDDLPTASFRQVLEWLDRHFEIVSLAELVDRISATGHRIPHCVALTFDDGLRNNLTKAQPILQELGLPATFFVCSGLVDDGRRLWTHDARFRFEHLRSRGVTLEPLGRWGFADGDPVEWMKTLAIHRRAEVEGWLATASPGFEPDARQLAASQLMDWDDLRSLDPDLITVGSHTLSHPMLSSLPLADAEREIRDSAVVLRSKFDRDVDFFCYPNGDHRPEHREIVREHYRAAVGTRPGVNLPGQDLTTLRRVPVSPAIRNFAWSTYRASA